MFVLKTSGGFELLLRILCLLVLLAGALIGTTHAQIVTYIHNDIAGTPMAATDASGNLLWKESYRPYGERLLNATNAKTNPLWFGGKPQDPTTGLSYLGARYYNPHLSRFMGIDPQEVNPEDLHSFNRYANNNPYKFVDPDGRTPETFWDAFNIGLGVSSLISNLREGHYGAATLDAAGVAVDSVAAIIPFIPGGAGSVIKVSRGVETAAKAVINPATVRFSQDSARAVFSNGGSIREIADALRSGTLKPDQVPPIRLIEKDNKLFTLDNRRLEAFRRAEMDVPYRMATPEEAASESWKFTTKNDGESIRIRGE